MIIFVDMDQTLNIFYENFVHYIGKHLNKKLELKREDLKNFLITKNIKETKSLPEEKRVSIVNHALNVPGFWENLPLYDGDVVRVMEELYKEHDVYIVTAGWVTSANCCFEKLSWIENNLPFFDLKKVIFTWDKFLLRGDLIIDDRPDSLETFHGMTLAIDWPYNRYIKTTYRENKWKEIGKLLLG